jgi:tRNA pseudouridine55 synthase
MSDLQSNLAEAPNDPGQILLIDKPLGWTSFDVVKKIRNAGKFKKIGHAGTLDPLATGLLICCTGKMTKSIEQIQAQRKVYEAKFTLGATTDSFDLESEVRPVADISLISKKDVEEMLARFLGPQEQIPPMFSAVMVNGQRAYTLARAGKAVELKAKPIVIEVLTLLEFNSPHFTCRIVCSKGTYIRSLARDFGIALGQVGCYLSALRRTEIGKFNVVEAHQVDELAHVLVKERVEHKLPISQSQIPDNTPS